jgi:hypothetical protein
MSGDIKDLAIGKLFFFLIRVSILDTRNPGRGRSRPAMFATKDSQIADTILSFWVHLVYDKQSCHTCKWKDRIK